MRVDDSTGKGTSGMDKFSSKVHRVHTELGGRLFNGRKVSFAYKLRLPTAVKMT
jgi:hypothetical protein